jgi:hypothetical protein
MSPMSLFLNRHRGEYRFILLKEKERKKTPLLEMRSPVQGGEYPSSQVPCLKTTAFKPLALPSPPHPLPTKRTFIYTQTTLTCPLLLLGTNTRL